MIFDNETRVEDDPRGEIRRFWSDMPAPAGRTFRELYAQRASGAPRAGAGVAR